MKNKTIKKTFGSRAEVFHGVAKKTTGGLLKKDLLKNKAGYIVSKKKYLSAKKEKRLQKYGYYAKKGKFGYVKKEVKNKTSKKSVKNKTMKKGSKKGKGKK